MADEQEITVVAASGEAAGISADPPITVIAATGVAITSTLSGNDDLADRIADAMTQAIRDCLDQGIIDPDVQRERMLAAREAVLNG